MSVVLPGPVVAAPTGTTAVGDHSEQSVCILCGIADSPDFPHTAIRRVRAGRVTYERFCSMCLQAEYGDNGEDPADDPWDA